MQISYRCCLNFKEQYIFLHKALVHTLTFGCGVQTAEEIRRLAFDGDDTFMTMFQVCLLPHLFCDVTCRRSISFFTVHFHTFQFSLKIFRICNLRTLIIQLPCHLQMLNQKVDCEREEDVAAREENKKKHADKSRRHSDIPGLLKYECLKLGWMKVEIPT